VAEQVIGLPNQAELRWVQNGIAVAARLAAQYTGKEEALPSLDLLGETFAAWAAAPRASRGEPNAIVNALGLALGQHLVNGAGLEWAVVSDEHGTDIAVHGEPGKILLFPTNATAKRCEAGEYRFFSHFFEQSLQHIARLRAEWE
jgi:hypothetical protein